MISLTLVGPVVPRQADSLILLSNHRLAAAVSPRAYCAYAFLIALGVYQMSLDHMPRLLKEPLHDICVGK